MDAVLNMMSSGSREVSANYVVKDSRIARVVPEELRSWSLSSAEWDGRSITFEIVNSSNGGSWPVSGASQESVARVVADIASRYGIPLNRERVLGHREVYTRYGASYPTACPGGLDMDWIVARAIEINNGGGTPGRKKSMTTLYHDLSTFVGGYSKDGTTLYALAGDGRGTAAWLETKDYSLAVAWARTHGSSIPLSRDTFASFKERYSGPEPVSGSGGGGSSDASFTAADRALLAATASKSDLAAAESSINANIDSIPAGEITGDMTITLSGTGVVGK